MAFATSNYFSGTYYSSILYLLSRSNTRWRREETVLYGFLLRVGLLYICTLTYSISISIKCTKLDTPSSSYFQYVHIAFGFLSTIQIQMWLVFFLTLVRMQFHFYCHQQIKLQTYFHQNILNMEFEQLFSLLAQSFFVVSYIQA